MKLIWTDFAAQCLKSIFNYYAEKTTKKVAHKIRKEILKSTLQLQRHPESGQQELTLTKLNQAHRYIVSGNYKIIYRIEKEFIIVIDVFDTRQNPDKMIDKTREL